MPDAQKSKQRMDAESRERALCFPYGIRFTIRSGPSPGMAA